MYDMHQQAKRYAEIATQAIMSSLGYKMGDEPIQRALELQGDVLFAEIIRGVAAGMKLRYLGIHETYGVLLTADGRGPYAPTLGWLNKRLLPETVAEQMSKERKEQRLFAGLTLIALLADMFPNPDAVRVESGQTSGTNAASVVIKLNEVADQVIAQRKAEGDDAVDGLLLAARFGADTVIKLSSVAKVYSADPKLNAHARPLAGLTWNELSRMNDGKWQPGTRLPFDPVAIQAAGKHELTVIFTGSDTC